jgi:hypothetical protein
MKLSFAIWRMLFDVLRTRTQQTVVWSEFFSRVISRQKKKRATKADAGAAEGLVWIIKICNRDS